MINKQGGNENTTKETRTDSTVASNHRTEEIATVSVCLTENHMECLGGYRRYDGANDIIRQVNEK
jgi:hypothetical protein